MKRPRTRQYRVWLGQVNQSSVIIRAASADEAMAKGYRKWRRDIAHTYVTATQEVEPSLSKRRAGTWCGKLDTDWRNK